MVATPSASSSFAVALPTPHSRSTGSGCQERGLAPGRHHDQPVGLPQVGRDLGHELVGGHARPTPSGRRLAAIRALIRAATAGPSPESASVPVTSRKASSMRDRLHQRRELGEDRHDLAGRRAAYLSMSTGRKTPCGQRRRRATIGIAERTPNRRASYEAAETTPAAPGIRADDDRPAAQLRAGRAARPTRRRRPCPRG